MDRKTQNDLNSIAIAVGSFTIVNVLTNGGASLVLSYMMVSFFFPVVTMSVFWHVVYAYLLYVV